MINCKSNLKKDINFFQLKKLCLQDIIIIKYQKQLKEIILKHFDYAIFDLDGTLLESMTAWKNLGQDYLIYKGIKPEDDLAEKIASMSTIEAAEYFQKAYDLKLSTDKIILEVNAFIENKYRYELELKPYVLEYLDFLKNKNVKMCIATASPLHLANLALKRNNIIDYFSFVLSCDEVGVGKNKPDVFYLAANKFNAAPSEIVIYDDADFAIITAKEAGFYTVSVYDDFYKDKRKDLEIISDLYIETFNELM